MKNQNCQNFVGTVHSSVGDGLRKCSRKAKYYCPDIDEYLCEVHLKKARAFSKNPVCLENGKEVDRHTLYRSGKVKRVEEDLK